MKSFIALVLVAVGVGLIADPGMVTWLTGPKPVVHNVQPAAPRTGAPRESVHESALPVRLPPDDAGLHPGEALRNQG